MCLPEKKQQGLTAAIYFYYPQNGDGSRGASCADYLFEKNFWKPGLLINANRIWWCCNSCVINESSSHIVRVDPHAKGFMHTNKEINTAGRCIAFWCTDWWKQGPCQGKRDCMYHNRIMTPRVRFISIYQVHWIWETHFSNYTSVLPEAEGASYPARNLSSLSVIRLIIHFPPAAVVLIALVINVLVLYFSIRTCWTGTVCKDDGLRLKCCKPWILVGTLEMTYSQSGRVKEEQAWRVQGCHILIGVAHVSLTAT